MTATDVHTPPRPRTSSPRPPRRGVRGRFSVGHVAVLAAGLVAAVANFAVLRASSGTTTVLAADTSIPVGAEVDLEVLSPVDVRIDGPALERLVTADAFAAADAAPRVAAVAIPEGALVRASDLRDAAAEQPGWRRMSVSLPRERAVGGAVAPEDRIDLIAVVEGEPAYVVGGARVLAVDDGGAGGLSVERNVTLTIAVNADAALCVADAVASGDLTAVLATGQEPAAVASCRQVASTSAGAASDGRAPASSNTATAAPDDSTVEEPPP